MADIKVSGLSASAAFLTTHEIPVNEGGTSKKVTGAQILAKTAQGTLASPAPVTANQGTFTAQTDLTGLAATITAAQANGRRIRVSCQVNLQSSIAADDVFLNIMEGATILQQINFDCPRANFPYVGLSAVILTPTNAAHTYKLSAARNAGSGNITMAASATNPAYILVEDITV